MSDDHSNPTTPPADPQQATPQPVLRVSLDDLADLNDLAQPVAAPTTTPAPDAPATRSYGNIHTPTEPTVTLPQQPGSLLLKAWFYLGLAGLLGATLGWAIAEPGFIDGEARRWGNTWLLPLIVALMCVAFAIAESLVERSRRKALLRVALALPLGIVLGFLLSFVANIIYSIALGICAQAGVQSFRNPAVWIARGLAWAVFGVAGGLVYGIIGRSSRKAGYGALGGAIGAAIGGILFDPISFLTHSTATNPGNHTGALSRAVGFALLGLATGVAMGLVESALKDRWLYVTAGPLAGKQFILYKPQTSIGSTQSVDIYLFKDPEILPLHATLLQRGDRIHLLPEGPVYLAGQPLRGTRVLESGNLLQLGRYTFRYQERPRG